MKPGLILTDSELAFARAQWRKTAEIHSALNRFFYFEDFRPLDLLYETLDALSCYFPDLEEKGMIPYLADFMDFLSYTDIFAKRYLSSHQEAMRALKAGDRNLLAMFKVAAKHIELRRKSHSHFLRYIKEQGDEFDSKINQILAVKREQKNYEVCILIPACAQGEEIMTWKHRLIEMARKGRILDFDQFRFVFVGVDREEPAIESAKEMMQTGYNILTAVTTRENRDDARVRKSLALMDEINSKLEYYREGVFFMHDEIPSQKFDKLVEHADMVILNEVSILNIEAKKELFSKIVTTMGLRGIIVQSWTEEAIRDLIGLDVPSVSAQKRTPGVGGATVGQSV